MSKRIRDHWKKIIGLGLVMGGLVWFFLLRKHESVQQGSPATYNQGGDIIMEVGKKGFTASLKKEGSIKIANEQKMKFGSNDRITSVLVSEGSRVTQGQVLASLDATSVNNSVKEARRSLTDAVKKMNDFKRDFKDAVIRRADQEEEDKKVEIEQKIRENDLIHPRQQKEVLAQKQSIAEAEKSLEQAKEDAKRSSTTTTYTNEDKVQKKLQEHKDVIEKEYVYLENYIQGMEDIFKNMDRVLQIHDKSFEYDAYFGSKESAMKSQAVRDAYLVYSQRKTLKEEVDKLSSRNQDDKLIPLLDKSQKLNEDFVAILDKLITVSDKSTTTQGFSESDISTLKRGFTENKRTVYEYTANIPQHKSIIISYNNTKDTIEDKIRQELRLDDNLEGLKLKQAKLSLTTERTAYDNLLIKHKEEKDTAGRQLESLRADLRLLQAKNKDIKTLATNPEYKSLLSSVEQAKDSLDEKSKRYEKYVLKAPFNGVVVEMNMRAGDLGDADDVYISITDPDAVQVMVSLNQSEIDKVKPGMHTLIKVDSYKDVTFSGSVLSVDAVPGVDGGGLTFKATISLKNTTDKKLYSGMTAGVEIMLQQLPESVVVPFTAVASDPDGRKYVTRMDKGQKEKVYVEVGYNDGRHYQIIKGLKEGDEILEIDYSQVKEKEAKEKAQEDGGGMGGGMMEMQMEGSMMY